MIFFNVITWHTIKEFKLVFHLDLVHFIYLFFLLFNFHTVFLLSHKHPSRFLFIVLVSDSISVVSKFCPLFSRCCSVSSPSREETEQMWKTPLTLFSLSCSVLSVSSDLGGHSRSRKQLIPQDGSRLQIYFLIEHLCLIVCSFSIFTVFWSRDEWCKCQISPLRARLKICYLMAYIHAVVDIIIYFWSSNQRANCCKAA